MYLCVEQTLNCLRKHHFDTDFNLTRQTLCIWSRVSSFSKLSCHHFKLIKQIIIEQDNVCTLPAESEGCLFTSVSITNQFPYSSTSFHHLTVTSKQINIPMFPVWYRPLLHQGGLRRVLPGGTGGRALPAGESQRAKFLQNSRNFVDSIAAPTAV